MITRKRHLNAGLLTGLVLCMSVCTLGRSDQIEVALFEGGEGLTFFTECARAYEREQSAIRVNLYGDPRIMDKLRVRILEGTFPEVTNADLNYWPLIRNGDVLALDEFLDQPSWEGTNTWRETFLPGALDRYQHQGRTYGIPLASIVNVIWYNKRLFHQHGWIPPSDWDEFFELCEQIQATGIAPLAFQGRYLGYAMAFIHAAYYHLSGLEAYVAQQNLHPGSFANPEMERALDLVQQTALRYFQRGAMGMSHTEAQLQFFLGHTAMVGCGSWLKSEMEGKIPDGFELGAFNLPTIKGGKGDPDAVAASGGYFFVMAHSRQPREAVEFLRFMTSREMAGEFARQRDMPVAIKGANEGNLSEDLADLEAILDRARSSYGAPPGEGFPGMTQHWDDMLFRLLTGRITPTDAANRLEETARSERMRALNPDAFTVNHVWKPVFLLGAIGLLALCWIVKSVRGRSHDGERRRTPKPGRCLQLSKRGILLFVGPAALLYTVFVIAPSLKSFVWSLYRWDGLTEMQPVGLLHFKRILFESDGFWVALQNNLFLMFMIPLFVLPLALFLAACLSRGVRGAGLFRVVFFFPNILGVVATSVLWMQLYNPQGGVINSALVGLGNLLMGIGLEALGGRMLAFEGFAWLSQENLYWALIPMMVWGACGFNMILFLAAMESIPNELYEAASIDGASAWHQFWSITLPLIWPVLSIAIVFMVISGMKAFEVIWLLTNQGPTTETHVIGTLMVQAMFSRFHVGEATAIAVLLFLMVFIGTAGTMRLMKRETVEF